MLRFLTAGESHGPALIGIIEGMPAGLELKESEIDLENVFLTVTGQAGSELRGKASDRIKEDDYEE